MKVLVLSVTAGQGHNSCAKAAMQALAARGASCKMLDTIAFLSSFVGKGVDRGYLLMGKLSPTTFGRLYEATLNNSIRMTRSRLTDLLTDGMVSKLAEYIDSYAPDCIITTHVFAAIIVTHLREEGLCRALTIGINTDFSIHPFWEQVSQDYFVLACSEMKYSAQLRGLDVKKILPFGLPVGPQFSHRLSKAEARAAAALPNQKTITVMSGSMGFGDITRHLQIIDTLPLKFQIVVICGNSRDAYEQVMEMKEEGNFRHEVFCYGYVDNVHELMQAADVLVTKPGGLSTTECLHVARPMVLMQPIPGLEEFNAAFLVNCGAAVYATEYYPLQEAVFNLLASKKRQRTMLSCQKAILPGVSAELLADFVLENYQKGSDCSHASAGQAKKAWKLKRAERPKRKDRGREV